MRSTYAEVMLTFIAVSVMTMAGLQVAQFLGVSAEDVASFASGSSPEEVSSADRAMLKTLLMGRLYDVNSVNYADLRTGGAPGVICGKLNAKNRFGAYVGFKHFYADINKISVEIEPAEENDYQKTAGQNRLANTVARSVFLRDMREKCEK